MASWVRVRSPRSNGAADAPRDATLSMAENKMREPHDAGLISISRLAHGVPYPAIIPRSRSRCQRGPSSRDRCFVAEDSIAEVVAHVRACGVEIIETPVEKAGATGPIRSIYFFDPDGNLIEVSTELAVRGDRRRRVAALQPDSNRQRALCGFRLKTG